VTRAQTAPTVIETPRLRLVMESTEAVMARIDRLSPADRAEVSPEWVARMRASSPSPWTHGFAIMDRATDSMIGSCGFKGPPDHRGVTEIAYGIDAEHRGRGYAKEAAAALVKFAFDAGVRVVRAHTKHENDASAHVLVACGFAPLGDVMDPEDGLVRRWEHLHPDVCTD
jgi:RimJ/RimL family protein N-acetyltransferase